MPFKSLGLSDPLVRGILATGYSAPTKIQSEAIPAALEGRDLIACAQTGTGKTAAFVLPILHRLELMDPPAKHRNPKALILTPTRELALQIEGCIQDYGRYLDIRALTVYGGSKMGSQLQALKRGIDILVATPGRLLDHMDRKSVSLSDVEVLVLDEADRMFDMGFIKDVQKIVRSVPKSRQTLLFSATISDDIDRLAGGIQKDPLTIVVGKKRNPIETINQRVYFVRKQLKPVLLKHMLNTEKMETVLIFSRTKHGADRITRNLQREGFNTIAIHSNRTQSQRLKALEGFKAGRYQIMVATDIAARGIDVEGISHVINYDVPKHPEDYVHRIGRTGRAEATGDAITLVTEEEGPELSRIEKYTDKYLEPMLYPDFDNEQAAPPRLPRGPRSDSRQGGQRSRGKGGSGRRRDSRGDSRSAKSESSQSGDKKKNSRRRKPKSASNSQGGGKQDSSNQNQNKKRRRKPRKDSQKSD
ncbi:ATP-dependent RNA helicase RhlE [Limihaloglobus sulfuriphilus]|uniref:DEAD-box ATP-dependent RNA helicase RhpA n=1 Tax=Limihaloglobus sulfuriphilus TaxID=1851148 RepID=A0A1Q2MIW6_9BACT|nr:DEAD/DEAH box helicase [Limihaloglobus sulfuriphilus]AQQ72478.1 ATP-dependent RNA helicase RhlE [Limihaloglobus sulfuriphilus]